MLHIRTRSLGTALVGIIALAALLGAGVSVRPGEPGLAQAAPASQDAPPDNDNFERRAYMTGPLSPPWASILPYTNMQDVRGATLESAEASPCASIGSSVWYELRTETAGRVAIDTFGSDYDTALAVYTFDPNGNFIPSPPGGNLLSLGCNNDDGGTRQSRVSVDVAAYQNYFVQVGAVGGAGTLKLNAACNPGCPPVNDTREFAQYAYVDLYQPMFTHATNTTAATTDAGEPQPCGGIGATVWYSFYPQSNQRIIFDTESSDFATVIAVYEEGGFEIPSPPGGGAMRGCNDGGGTGRARLAVDARPGRNYWIQVGGHNGASGSLIFTASCDGPCPPYNDSLQFGYSSLPYIEEVPTTAGASTQDGEPTGCGDMGKTLWYGVYAEGDTTIVIDTSRSDFDTAIAVYDDPNYAYDITKLDQVACDSGGAGQQATLRIPVKGQQPLYVQIGGRNGDSGFLATDIDCDPSPCPPPYDSMLNPNWLQAPAYLPQYQYHDTRGATVEDGEPTSCGNMGNTIWYYIESTGTTTLRFTTANNSFPVAIAVYDVTSSDRDTVVGSERIVCADGSTQPAVATFDIAPGEVYRVQIGGRNGASGDMEMQVDCLPACPPWNDSIGNPWYIGSPQTGELDTRAATLDPGETQPCGGDEGLTKTVWFSVESAGFRTDSDAQSGRVTVSTAGSDFETVIAVYTSEGFSPPGGATEMACGKGTLSFDAEPNRQYHVQIGGVAGAGGQLRFSFECSGNCPGGYPGGLPGGGIVGPDTGSGGYVPGSRQR